jgi:hypothetical protein
MSAPLRRDGADPASIDVPPWKRRAPPVAPGDVAAPRFIGDRAMIELRRRLALEPENAPEPPPALHAGLPMDRLALRFGAVIALAALVAWGVVSFSRARLPADEVRQARVAPAIPMTTVKLLHVRTAAAATRPAPARVEMPAGAHVTFAADEKAPAPPSSVPLWLQQSGLAIAVKTAEPAPPAASSSAAASKPGLDAEAIAMLVKRAKAFMTDGDVVAARLLLQRAAEAGSAAAALALAASFDPLIVKQAGAVGVQTDAAQARQWYQRAAALGSDAASKELANLASAGQ